MLLLSKNDAARLAARTGTSVVSRLSESLNNGPRSAQLMALRGLANCCSCPELAASVTEHSSAVLPGISF